MEYISQDLAIEFHITQSPLRVSFVFIPSLYLNNIVVYVISINYLFIF